MGNRAIVIFHDKKNNSISPAVYLHWNGGPESIYAFLDEMDRRNVRRGDVSYEAARFAHIVGDYFDHGKDGAGGMSLGLFNGPAAISVDTLRELNQGDNGVFVVSRNHGSKPNRKVQRFVGYEENFGEMKAREVSREYQEAKANNYNSAIAESLMNARPVINQND